MDDVALTSGDIIPLPGGSCSLVRSYWTTDHGGKVGNCDIDVKVPHEPSWPPRGPHVGKEDFAALPLFEVAADAHDDWTDPAKHEPTWLVIEWPEGEARPTEFFLTSLPRRMSKKRIVRTLKERRKTERAYQELKSELGLDHYEGRSFIGWHHHVSVVLCCYAFVVAERILAFPPRADGPVAPTRWRSRPERHFADWVPTARLVIA